jgi:hypothetical protein
LCGCSSPSLSSLSKIDALIDQLYAWRRWRRHSRFSDVEKILLLSSQRGGGTKALDSTLAICDNTSADFAIAFAATRETEFSASLLVSSIPDAPTGPAVPRPVSDRPIARVLVPYHSMHVSRVLRTSEARLHIITSEITSKIVRFAPDA